MIEISIEWIWLVLGLGLGVFASFWLVYYMQARRLPEPRRKALSTGYSFQTLDLSLPFDRRELTIEGQSEPWRMRMLQLGEVYASADVASLVLVHGTFAGTDPFGMVPLLKKAYPGLSAAFEMRLKRRLKAGANKILKDTANFTPAYLELTRRAFQDRLAVHDYQWSSENHHIARVRGMLGLLERLNVLWDKGTWSENKACLLMGHSHAGQLFALLHLLLHPDHSIGKDLLTFIERNLPQDWLQAALAKIGRGTLYYVMLGTPPRYPWSDVGLDKVLNIINHRGDELHTTGYRGLLRGTSGDYIQLYGIEGSDLQSSVAKDRLLNRQLDAILGPGIHLPHWRSLTRQRQRALNGGYSLLMDFKEASFSKKAALSSILGHGVYTRYDYMLPIHEAIQSHFFHSSS